MWRGAIGAALGLALVWATLAPRDPGLFPPRAGEAAVRVVVVDHGFHAGLVLATDALADAAAALAPTDPGEAGRLEVLARRWPAAEWLEIGWGDGDFYRATRRLADLDSGLAWAALTASRGSLLHVAPGRGPVGAAFPGAARVGVVLGAPGFRRLALALAREMAPGPQGVGIAPRGPGLYASAEFLGATGRYGPTRTCNAWVAGLLRAAGVPASGSLGLTSLGLRWELVWRARGELGYMDTP